MFSAKKIKQFISGEVVVEINRQMIRRISQMTKTVKCEDCKITMFKDNAQVIEFRLHLGKDEKYYCDEHKKEYDTVLAYNNKYKFIKKSVEIEVDSEGKEIKNKK